MTLCISWSVAGEESMKYNMKMKAGSSSLSSCKVYAEAQQCFQAGVAMSDFIWQDSLIA